MALARSPFLVFLEPPAVDKRIISQHALFSLMSSPRADMDEWLQRHPELCRKVIVPAELKWEIRDKLDQANINERILFPDLDGLSRWLARYYLPASRPGDAVAGVDPREGVSCADAPAPQLHARRRNHGTRRTRSAAGRPAPPPRAA
jgi:hypothetical protein